QTATVPVMGSAQNWSWAYQILQYLDQENLWRSQNSIPGDATVLAAMVPAFSCPSRRPMTVWTCDNTPPHPVWRDPSLSRQFLFHYAGNGGPDSKTMTGLIVPLGASPLKVSSVRSLSNTLLVGEKYLSINTYGGGESGGDDISGFFTYKPTNIRYGFAGPYQDGPAGASSLSFYPCRSAHPQAMNALFGDG